MSALSLTFPPDFARAVAEQLADVLIERGIVGGDATTSPYLTTDEAADYLRCKPQRIHDLTSQGRLRVCKDGSRSLFRREDLDLYLSAERRAA
ncbi:MAG TPA: helix-turn-helix domain-containing protein [Solirubrobacter sp.]|nr:helix-turn-helix domain-containing protein [Solirubrobacter sp.]